MIWKARLRILSIFLLLATVGTVPEASAQPDPTKHWTLNLYFENDLFSSTDKGYTNGMRASWVSPDLEDYFDDPELPRWIQKVNRGLSFFYESRYGLQRNLTFSIGQTIYTPKDFRREDLIVDDRPYAAWLFASMGYQARNDDNLDTLEVRLGVVGPAALGRESQGLIHDMRGIERFEGWDNQLSNELGAVYLWEHKRKFSYIYHQNSRFGLDLIGHAGIALGNVATYLNAGGELRIGWAIPDDFGTSAIRPGGDNSTPNSIWDPRLTGKGVWGAHMFLSIDLRRVGRDIFLDGNSFADSHSVQKEQYVGDAALGFSFIYSGTKISYAQIFRSREFKLQDRGHSYGSLAFSYTFR